MVHRMDGSVAAKTVCSCSLVSRCKARASIPAGRHTVARALDGMLALACPALMVATRAPSTVRSSCSSSITALARPLLMSTPECPPSPPSIAMSYQR